MLLFNFIVHIHVLVYVIHATLLPSQPENIKHLQRCIQNIEEEYFKPSDFIIFINLNETLKHFHLNTNAVVNLNHHIQDFISFTFFTVNAYVLIGPEDFIIQLMKSLSTTSYWNPRAKFLIILNREPSRLFIVLNSHYVYNVIVLISKMDNLADIYSMFPYDISIPTEERLEPYLINRCYNGVFLNHTDLFPNKLPRVWDSITVRVLLLEYPPYVICRDCADEDKSGIEIRILKLVGRILGFKIKYIKQRFSTWGKLLPNRSYTDAYGFLQKRKADVAIGIFTANYTENWYFDLSFPYLEDTHRWVVPAARREPSWKNIVNIFHWSIWALMVSSLVAISGTLYFIGVQLSELKNYREFLRCFLLCLQCLLGQCVHRQPNRFSVRIGFILWAFLSWLIAVAFQSHLIAALNFSTFEKQISNIQELIGSKLQIGFYDFLASLFTSQDTHEDVYILKNFVTCPLDIACLNKTAFQGNFATIEVKRFLDNIIHERYLGSDGRPLLHVFKRELFYILINMVFTKGFPLYERINKLLLLLKSSGFIERNYRRESRFPENIFTQSQTNMQADVLDIYEVQGMFALLFLGWLLSVTVFIAEHALRPEKFLSRHTK